MSFGWFSKKKEPSLHDLLVDHVMREKALGQLARAQSLRKLGRGDEASRVLAAVESQLVERVKRDPLALDPRILLILIYTEAGASDRAMHLLTALLQTSTDIPREHRMILEGALQKLQREMPADARPATAPQGFTQVYSCQRCGRLHNFVSMPCPHCDWAPQTSRDCAQSIVLSSTYIPVASLLGIARAISSGRPANSVVANLESSAEELLAFGDEGPVPRVLGLLKEHAHKHHRSFALLKECGACGEPILDSTATACAACDAEVDWPEIVRAIVCCDNLLWLLEQRVEPNGKPAFSEFVCVLVSLANDLLRKQEAPSDRIRHYLLEQIRSMGGIHDLGGGAVVQTSDPRALKIFLVQSNMREDSELFGLFLYKELETLIRFMSDGIRV